MADWLDEQDDDTVRTLADFGVIEAEAALEPRGIAMTAACGYCGAPKTPGQDDQVHEIGCPFVPERERRVREKLVELEERIRRLETP